MNTTTDRHSKSYHKRQIDSAFRSDKAAHAVWLLLHNAIKDDPSLAKNDYFVDTLRQARERADEMTQDVDDTITAAMEDGFGPEDFD